MPEGWPLPGPVTVTAAELNQRAPKAIERLWDWRGTYGPDDDGVMLFIQITRAFAQRVAVLEAVDEYPEIRVSW